MLVNGVWWPCPNQLHEKGKDLLDEQVPQYNLELIFDSSPNSPCNERKIWSIMVEINNRLRQILQI